jgi:pimeloyl-ACP methyl ester carboxylesterase
MSSGRRIRATMVAAVAAVSGAGHFAYVEQPKIVWPAVERFLGSS